MSSGSDRGKALLIEGRHQEALEFFANLLRTHPDDHQALDGASRADRTRARRVHRSHGEHGRARSSLSRQLVLQTPRDSRAPVFHDLIVASQQTSKDSDVIRRLAKELTPLLAEIYQTNTISNSYVVMLLVLRNTLGGWISQDEITRLHIEWFRTFNLAYLVLPYSCMFHKSLFMRNRDDLARVVSDSARASRFLDDLSLVQMVFLEWLLESDVIARRGDGDIRRLLTSSLVGRPVRAG